MMTSIKEILELNGLEVSVIPPEVLSIEKSPADILRSVENAIGRKLKLPQGMTI